MMADLTIGPIAGPRPGTIADRALGREALAATFDGLAEGWRAWRRYRHLRAMGAADLARLGVARSDIARHAVFGATEAGRSDPADEPGLSYEAVEHDLRTPLTSIRSLAEILLDCPDLGEAERRRFLGVLVQENERLGRVVERLLGEPGLRRVVG